MATYLKDYLIYTDEEIMIDYKGFLSLTACAGVFALSSMFVRYLSFEMSDLLQAIIRMFLASFLVLSIFMIKRRKVNLSYFKWWQFIGFALAFPLVIILLTISINMIKIASAIFYLYVGKMFAAVLLDVFVFKEKLNMKRTISVVLLFIGLNIFLNPFADGFSISLGIVLGLISGVLASIDGAFRKVLSPKFDRWFLVWLPMFTGVIIAFILLINSGGTLEFGFSNWVYLVLFFSSISLVASQLLMLIGFRHCDINLGTILLSTELIFTVIFAAICFGEHLTINEIIGSAFVILAIINRNSSLSEGIFFSPKQTGNES